MNEVSKDVNKINITRLPTRNLKIKLPEFDLQGCFIAGGAVRDSIIGEQFNDIDVYGSDENLDKFEKANFGKFGKCIHNSEVLKSYLFNGIKIQLVYRKVLTPEEAIRCFDLTICQFAYDGQTVFCNSESIIHLYEKKLIINSLNYPLDTLRRLQKYIKRGYSICDGGIKEIVDRIRLMTPEAVENAVNFYPDGSVRIVRFD